MVSKESRICSDCQAPHELVRLKCEFPGKVRLGEPHA